MVGDVNKTSDNHEKIISFKKNDIKLPSSEKNFSLAQSKDHLKLHTGHSNVEQITARGNQIIPLPISPNRRYYPKSGSRRNSQGSNKNSFGGSINSIKN